MKAKEIKDLTTEEIKEKIGIESEAYGKMRLNHAVAAFENPVQLRLKRKDIARLQTELRMREISGK